MNSSIMDKLGQLMSKLAATVLSYTGTRDESHREYQEFLRKVDYLLELGQYEAGVKKIDLRKTQNFIQNVHFILEKFNACMHTLNEDAETKLHLVVRECRCAEDSEAAYKETIDSALIFMLRKADMLNERDCNGRTALMMAAENGCLHIVRVLVDWANEPDGVKVDLDAEDIYGETALYKAVLHSRVEVVDFLIRRGALDICNNQGFSALHAAVRGPRHNVYETSLSEFFGDFCWLAFMEHSFNLLNETYNVYSHIWKQLELKTRSSGKTVKLIDVLLLNYPGCLNAKDFRGKTALDWAIRSKTRISELTVSKLNQMTKTEKQTNQEELLGIDDLGRTSFHRLAAMFNPEEGNYSQSFIDIIHQASNIKEIDLEPIKTMTCRKDWRGRTALHYAAMTGCYQRSKTIEAIVKLGCSVNERDVFGRTPLHYATKEVYEFLLNEHGADDNMKDIDGKIPLDLNTCKLRQKEESNSIAYQEKLKLEDDKEYDHIWKIWTARKYAFREPISGRLIQGMECFLDRLAEGIGKKDPRFKCRPVLVGSAYEGTRIGFMDEFDFDLVLTKFGEHCVVCPAPEAPVGFVRLQRKLNPSGDGELEKRSQNELNFDEFFNKNGVLMSNKVASRFRCLYSEVMKQPSFWESEPCFEWDLHNEFGSYSKNRYMYSQCDLKASRNLCTNIVLRLNRPIDGQYIFQKISVDIVPCIRVAGWWPDGILSSISKDLSAEGCYLVFDQPQRKYPRVPYSTDPYVRISFAQAESRVIKESSVLAKAAFMVVKQILSDNDAVMFTHVFKNSLLYCIEALNDDRNKNMTYEQIRKEDLRLFVSKLMLCFFEFYHQGFCPCYMMPSFSLPSYYEFEIDRMAINDRPEDSKGHRLYCTVSCSIPDLEISDPHPVFQSLFEKFDRDELMRKLSKIQLQRGNRL